MKEDTSCSPLSAFAVMAKKTKDNAAALEMRNLPSGKIERPESKTNSVSKPPPQDALPSSETVQQGHLSLDNSKERTQSQPKKKAMQPRHGTTDPSSKTAEQQPKKKVNHVSTPKTKLGTKHNTAVRRSGRIQSAVLPSRKVVREPIFEDITGTDSENEGEAEPEAPKEDLLKLNPEIERLDTSIAMLFKQVEAISNRSEHGPCLLPCNSNSNLHVDCQNKIEALTKERDLLAMKLENTHARLEELEKWNQLMMGRLKEIFILCLNRTSDTVGKISSQPLADDSDLLESGGHAHAAKKKRIADELGMN